MRSFATPDVHRNRQHEQGNTREAAGLEESLRDSVAFGLDPSRPSKVAFAPEVDDVWFPFHVYGASQDEGAFEGPSATANGAIALGDWQPAASGESTYVAPEPNNPDVTYGSAYYSALIRQDDSVGEAHNVSPWPTYLAGASASETKYRFGWTHPIMFSPANDRELLEAAQNVFSSTDGGQTWKVISPDLTRNDKATEGPSGGPIDLDQTGAETFPDVASLAVSPLNGDVLWAGSADGLVHVTTNHGAAWTLVTPPQLPQWAQISSIEASHTAAGTAYLTASRYMWDDFHPYAYVTMDYGAHWTTLTRGIPADQYVFVVRQDPREPRLLFAGTRSTVYVSFNGGELWQPLTLHLPGVQMRDIAIDARQGEVIVATHGRAFWILDNLALLEALARDEGPPSSAAVRLFTPETAWLSHAYGAAATPNLDTGKNPQYGATVYFNLPADYTTRTPLTLAFADAHGTVIRTFTLHARQKHEKKVAPEIRYEMNAMQRRVLDLHDMTGVEPGMNRFGWDMRYPPAIDVRGFKEPEADNYRASVDGPTIVPGDYTVLLRYGGQQLVQPLHVKLDPRLHATPEELDARLALELRIHATLDKLDSTINAARAAAVKLPPPQRGGVEAAVAEVVQLDIHSTEGDIAHEDKLRTHLAFLANELESAYARPTAAELATFDDLAAQAAAGEARLEGAVAAVPPAKATLPMH